MPATPQYWFLQFNTEEGDGRPWADKTAMAGRARLNPPQDMPWDENCTVTTFVDGYAAMSAMRDALEGVIKAANAPGAPPFGERGRVYIAGWRFDTLSWHCG